MSNATEETQALVLAALTGGSIAVIVDVSTLATQTTLAAMSAKLPAALGPTTPALSLSVTQAASASWAGVTVTLDTTGLAIGAGTYNAGIVVTNLDSSITIYIADTLAHLADAATRYALIPGINPSVVIPFANAAGIFAKSASGAPLLSWIGAA